MPSHIFQRGKDQPHRTAAQWKALRRVNDLTRYILDKYPNGLPHNGLGFKLAKYICRTKAFDPIDDRAQWLDRYAPFLSSDERTKILSYGAYWYSARSLGEHLELYDEDRERLKAWTIEAWDITPDQRKQINIKKSRQRQEKHRRKNGAQPRDEYLASFTERPKPYELTGETKSSYYRRLAKERGTGSVTALSSLQPPLHTQSQAVAVPPVVKPAVPEQGANPAMAGPGLDFGAGLIPHNAAYIVKFPELAKEGAGRKPNTRTDQHQGHKEAA